MKKHTSLALLVGMLLASLAITQPAQAITVQTSGQYNDPTASSWYFYNRIYNQDNAVSPSEQLPPNLNSSTDSVAYFGWGIDVEETIINQDIIQSHFWFNGVGSVDGGPAAMTTLGNPFSLGSFTYTNEETILSGGLVEIDFQMDIMVDGLSLLPVEYRIEIDNTPNSWPDNMDTARILSGPNDISFFLDGSQYLLSLNGFSRDGGLTFETEASLAENAQTSAEIYATITVVPVPAAVWLMISGLFALYGFARTKK